MQTRISADQLLLLPMVQDGTNIAKSHAVRHAHSGEVKHAYCQTVGTCHGVQEHRQ